MAAAIGLGNGAVFKLVPEYFPKSVGGVTGLVGAAGGLGGFFPPLVLGMIKQQTGSFTLGFVLLSVFALACLMVLLLSMRSPRIVLGHELSNEESQADRPFAARFGHGACPCLGTDRCGCAHRSESWSAAVALRISIRRWFPTPAQPCSRPLVWAIATRCGCAVLPPVSTGFADGRYSCNPRGCPANFARLAGIFWNNVVLQRFIERRSKTRWTAHWFLAWGCLIAAAVTFPLSFGWIRFETAPDNQAIYRAFVFGIHVGSFPLTV